MQRLMAIGLFMGILGTSPLLAAEPTPTGDRSGFMQILKRVMERDATSDAILSVAALSDAPDPNAKLTLTIKPLGKTNIMLVELRDANDRSTVLESYRFAATELLLAEAEKLKRPKTTAKAAAGQPGYAFLKTPYLPQGRGGCTASVVASILQYYAQPISPEKVKELTNSVTKRPEFAGIFFVDVVNGVKLLGFDWETTAYQLDAESFQTGLNDIFKSLDAGSPVVIDTTLPPGGRAVAVIGYDPKQRLIFINDPLLPAPGLRQATYAEFEALWRSVLVETRGAIFTKPKRQP